MKNRTAVKDRKVDLLAKQFVLRGECSTRHSKRQCLFSGVFSGGCGSQCIAIRISLEYPLHLKEYLSAEEGKAIGVKFDQDFACLCIAAQHEATGDHAAP